MYSFIRISLNLCKTTGKFFLILLLASSFFIEFSIIIFLHVYKYQALKISWSLSKKIFSFINNISKNVIITSSLYLFKSIFSNHLNIL